jgi:penicillin-binding protein 2
MYLSQEALFLKIIRKRSKIIFTFVIFFFLVIILRLWYLQILKGDYYKELSDNNRIRLIKIKAPRGMIFDRYGKTLAKNLPSFDLALIPNEVSRSNIDTLLNNLKNFISFNPVTLKRKLNQIHSFCLFKPLVIKEDLKYRELTLFEINKLDLPGFLIMLTLKRNYPYEDHTSHLIGYLSETTEKEIETNLLYNRKSVEKGDFVGRSGIEKIFNNNLMGENGGRQVEIDAYGQELQILKEVSAIPGNSLFLTIDINLQKKIKELLKDLVGVVIVLNPNNGEILALENSPSFDPNIFSRGITREKWKNLLKHPYHPLENRAIQCQYPPGSIFKIVTAIAGLEEGLISPESRFFCNGKYNLSKYIYGCWKKEGHGSMNLEEAIVQSCDIYFYMLGRKLGIDKIYKYAKFLGLGEKTGVLLENEKKGLIPNSKWKKKTLKEPWLPGETISCAIGQSFIQVTPLQIAILLSVVANNGYIYKPLLVKKIEDSDGKVIQEFPPQILKKIPISEKNLKFIRESLFKAVYSSNCTGQRAKIPDFKFGGKTGTVQIIGKKKLEEIKKCGEIPFKFRDHALFAAYAPLEKPQIVVVVLIEHGGHGGVVAAPIAREIIKFFFFDSKKEEGSEKRIVFKDKT